MHTKWIRKMV